MAKIERIGRISDDGVVFQDFRLLPEYYEREIAICKHLQKTRPELRHSDTLFSIETWSAALK